MQIRDLAVEAAKIEPIGRINKKRLDAATAVGFAVVDAIQEQAQKSVEQVRVTSTKAQSAAWLNIVDLLNESGIDLRVTCAKSGLLVYELSQNHFPDFLAALSEISDTPEADKIELRLLNAISHIKSATVLPQYAVTHAEQLAFLRLSSPLDYCVIAIQRAFPSLARELPERVRRVQDVAKLRETLAQYSKETIIFLSECLTIYLTHVRPESVPPRCSGNTLEHYANHRIYEIVQSESHIAHLCQRIVQLIFNLIAKHNTRPLNTLAQSDLIALRVHYVGCAEYRESKTAFRKLQAARVKLDAQADKIAKSFNLSPSDKALLGNAADELEMFDLVLASQMTVKKRVRILAESEKSATKIKAVAELAAKEETTELLGLLSFDGMDFTDPELYPAIDDLNDLIIDGSYSEDELADAGFTLDDDDADWFTDDEPEAEHISEQAVFGTIMQDAMKQAQEHAKPVSFDLSFDEGFTAPAPASPKFKPLKLTLNNAREARETPQEPKANPPQPQAKPKPQTRIIKPLKLKPLGP